LPQNQIPSARETIATAGYTKLLFTEIGVLWGGESGQLLANVLKRSGYPRLARDQYAWMRTPSAESRAWLAS
jgi:hypothetical protein